MLDHSKDHHSQCGEDGIIEFLFEKFKINDGLLVEFGAWDGIHLSNTYHHFEKSNHEFELLLIEADEEKYLDLLLNFEDQLNSKVKTLKTHIEHDPNHPNNINKIFEKQNLSGREDFQLLSIDVDGYDFDIWKCLDKNKFKPKIVIIEFGVHPERIGSSGWHYRKEREELYGTFREDGYTLAVVTGNFIFVKDDLGLEHQDEEKLFFETNGKDVAKVKFDEDGDVIATPVEKMISNVSMMLEKKESKIV